MRSASGQPAGLAAAPRRCLRHRLRATCVAPPSPPPGGPRVVVLGGGFGGLTVALRLGSMPWPGGAAAAPRVTLVDRSARFLFKPLAYELVTGELPEAAVAPPFAALLAGSGVAFLRADVAAVAPDCPLLAPGAAPGSPFAGSVGGGVVRLRPAGDADADGDCYGAAAPPPPAELPYDYLVVALGATPSASAVPGAEENALAFSTLADVRRLVAALAAARARCHPCPATVLVVGGGVGAVELACSVAGAGASDAGAGATGGFGGGGGGAALRCAAVCADGAALAVVDALGAVCLWLRER